MCMKMPFKMLNAWTRLIIVQVTSDNDKFSLFHSVSAAHHFANQLFNVLRKMGTAHTNTTKRITNHSTKWDSAVGRKCACVCVCVTFRRESFFFNLIKKMLANSNNANNLGFRCFATDESECNAEFGVTIRIQLYWERERKKKKEGKKSTRTEWMPPKSNVSCHRLRTYHRQSNK